MTVHQLIEEMEKEFDTKRMNTESKGGWLIPYEGIDDEVVFLWIRQYLPKLIETISEEIINYTDTPVYDIEELKEAQRLKVKEIISQIEK